MTGSQSKGTSEAIASGDGPVSVVRYVLGAAGVWNP